MWRGRLLIFFLANLLLTVTLAQTVDKVPVNDQAQTVEQFKTTTAAEWQVQFDSAEKAYYAQEYALAERLVTNFQQAQPNVSDSLLIDFGRLESKVHYKQKHFSKGIASINAILQLTAKVFGEDSYEFADLHYRKGAHQRKSGIYTDAIDNYRFFLNYKLSHKDERRRNIQAIYGNMGLCFHENGDLEQASNYYIKSLELSKDDPYSVSLSYTNLGNIAVSRGDIRGGINYGYKCLKEQEKLYPEENYDLSRTYKNLGNAYMFLPNFDSAKICIDKAVGIRERVLGKGHVKTANIYGSVGTYYFNQAMFEEAMEYYELEYSVKLNSPDADNIDLAGAERSLADCALALEDFEVGLDWCDKALASLLAKETNNPSRALPSVEVLPFSRFSFYILEIKGNIYKKRHEQIGQSADLDSARECYVLLTELIDRIRLSHMTYSGKQEFANRFHPIYEAIIAIDCKRYQANGSREILESMFSNSERSKTAALLDALRDMEAKSVAGIADDYREEEQRLKYSYHRLAAELDELPSGSLERARLQSEASDLAVQRDRLIAKLEKEYPAYHQLKYSQPDFDLKAMQQALGGETTLLEFFTGEQQSFVFLVRQDTAVIQEIAIAMDSLLALLEQFKDGLSGWFLTTNDRKELSYYDNKYIDAASKLYQLLLEPLDGKLTRKLVIVPDGPLGYLPFDLLLKVKKTADFSSYANYPYLLKDHVISYEYNGLLELNDRSSIMDNRMAVFSPAVDGAFQKLPHAEREAQQLTELMQAAFFGTGNASKEAFIKHAPTFEMLHITSHGVINDENPLRSYLVFEPNDKELVDFEELYLSDIYGLPLEAKLVVLSACETGSGTYQKGGGISSLAHAFTYAGAESLLTTLWPVNDGFSADFMVAFYGKLKLRKGSSKDDALQQTKLEFAALNQHPFLWGGFIPIGDMSPIKGNATWQPMLALALLIAGILLLLYVVGKLIRRKRNRVPQ